MAAVLLAIGLVGFAAARVFDVLPVTEPESTVVVGEPGGGLVPQVAAGPAAPLPPVEQVPDPVAPERNPPVTTPHPTPDPEPVAVEPVAVAPVELPAVAPPAPPAVPPPPPAVVAVAAITPDQAVATWYAYVESGQFDAAYALWTDRMKAQFARAGNLDGRWANTADVSFQELYVVQQTATWATVQTVFVEIKDDGSSRLFVGWWELVRHGDGWLLDQPHF